MIAFWKEWTENLFLKYSAIFWVTSYFFLKTCKLELMINDCWIENILLNIIPKSLTFCTDIGYRFNAGVKLLWLVVCVCCIQSFSSAILKCCCRDEFWSVLLLITLNTVGVINILSISYLRKIYNIHRYRFYQRLLFFENTQWHVSHFRLFRILILKLT